MKHCCLQGSLRVWSWSCSSCLRDLRSWRARDWGDKCREQLGNPPKNLFCSESHLPQRPPEDEHARLRQEFYISLLWLKASQLTLLKKRPKWTVASSELLCLSLTSKLCWSDLLLMENCVSSVWSLPFSSRIMQKKWGKKLSQGPYILNKMSQGLRPCPQMWILTSPMPHASHSPSGQILHIAFCWRGNELLEQDCLLGPCLAGLASGLMVCLLAESTRYLTQHYLDILESPKRTLNWPRICQWDPPSQAFYPSNRTCINCWNLSNEHLQVSKSRQRELAGLLRHNHGEILHFIWKDPGKWWNCSPLTTRPLNFCCLSGNTCHFQCGLTWYLHNDSYVFLSISRLTQTTHTNRTWCPC